MLADTIGVATPSAVRSLTERVVELGRPVGGHFHNTRNTGYANALAALEAGASVLDASIGGLGGCPFAPRATGNIATEDLVYALEREGVSTGIDLDGLIRTSEWVAEVLGRQPRRSALPGGHVPAADELAARGEDRRRAPRRARARRPGRAARPRRRPRGTFASSRRRARSDASPFRVSSISEPSLPRSGPGDRPGGEQVAGRDRRAVHRRVRELLRHRPVEAACVRARDDRAAELDLELDVERPVALGAEVRQRLGILRRRRRRTGPRAARAASPRRRSTSRTTCRGTGRAAGTPRPGCRARSSR